MLIPLIEVNPTSFYAIDTGVADLYVVTLNPPITVYTTGLQIEIKILNTNLTNTPTININGIGNKTIVNADGTPIGIGSISANTQYVFRYDGTNFIHTSTVGLQTSGGALTGKLLVSLAVATDPAIGVKVNGDAFDRLQLLANGHLMLGDGATTPINSILAGNGTPEGVVSAPIGSMYLRRDGAVGSTLYVQETVGGNTGWTSFSLFSGLAANSVGTAELAANAVTTAKILDANVTAAKLAQAYLQLLGGTLSGKVTSSLNVSTNPALAVKVDTDAQDRLQILANGQILLGNGTSVPITAILSGSGSPEGVIVAPIGSIYLRDDGAISSTLYIKETGSVSTGWTAYSASGVGPNTVGTTELIDSAVTTVKINNNAITQGKMVGYAVGTYLLHSNDAIKSTSTGSILTLMKQIQIPRDGVLRIDYEVATGNVSFKVTSNIYRNGVAVGTQRQSNIIIDSYTLFTETISGWSNKDLVEIRAFSAVPGVGISKIKNLRLYTNFQSYTVPLNLVV